MSFFDAFAVLQPQGPVALAERGLMVSATFFMLIVAVPVFFLLFFFARRYRAGNHSTSQRASKKPVYSPNWEHGKMEELVWWAIPFEIVLILGALTWSSTHALDPRAPLEGGEPLVVQVVALDWKWLFIYPEQEIATVNYVGIPVGRPVRFEITADAPMNSFWIPQLGGQIYAMTGMVNTLNLVANNTGTFKGLSANYSGGGFSHMKFVAVATTPKDFDAWIKAVQESSNVLQEREYRLLAAPSVASSVVYYGSIQKDLYSTIVSKFNHLPAHPH